MGSDLREQAVRNGGSSTGTVGSSLAENHCRTEDVLAL